MSDSDFALAPPPKPLSPDQILRRGILSLEAESSEAVERLVTEQQATYRQILKDQGPEPLIEALLARDRQLARTGRELATGRAASKMLREFVRGLLHLADHASLRRVGDATKAGQIEGILEALGAEPADLKTLRQAGTTLGPLEDPAVRAEQLADGRRKQ
jgi:hypothetical protein